MSSSVIPYPAMITSVLEVSCVSQMRSIPLSDSLLNFNKLYNRIMRAITGDSNS